MGDTVRCVSDHAEDLGDGTVVPVGEFAYDVDPDDPINQRLFAEGRIIKVPADSAPPPPKLTGEALKLRAKALDIEGRSEMSADELRTAIAAAEEQINNTKGDDS